MGQEEREEERQEGRSHGSPFHVQQTKRSSTVPLPLVPLTLVPALSIHREVSGKQVSSDLVWSTV